MLNRSRKSYASLWAALLGVVWPAIAETPSSLDLVRSTYEREFVRELTPIQQKYVRALEQYQRDFTRAGNLSAASEARREAGLAKIWKTIPVHLGRRVLENPELSSLLHNYETAVAKVTDPLAERHIAALERVQGSLSRSGDLDAALLVEKEIKGVRSGEISPAEAGLRIVYEQFSREGFEEWLLMQTIQFSGKIAGRTVIKFDGENLSYDSGSAGGVVTFPYNVDTMRSVEIDNGRFRIQFAKDLMSGTFESKAGAYEIIFLTEDKDETELED